MKTTMILAFGAALLCGCSEPAARRADTADLSGGSFPVAEARSIFEEALAPRVRSRAESGPEDAGFFAPGEVAPAWSEAREVPAGEVPAGDFYRFVSREESDTLDVVAIPRTLVVMKDPASGMESVYFCLYVADAEFAAWCAGRPRSEWIDGKAKNGFTGIVLYTTLSGRIAAAGTSSDPDKPADPLLPEGDGRQ